MFYSVETQGRKTYFSGRNLIERKISNRKPHPPSRIFSRSLFYHRNSYIGLFGHRKRKCDFNAIFSTESFFWKIQNSFRKILNWILFLSEYLYFFMFIFVVYILILFLQYILFRVFKVKSFKKSNLYFIKIYFSAALQTVNMKRQNYLSDV